MTPNELIDLNIDDEILAVVSFYSPLFFFFRTQLNIEICFRQQKILCF
jgi:hypothetical protein